MGVEESRNKSWGTRQCESRNPATEVEEPGNKSRGSGQSGQRETKNKIMGDKRRGWGDEGSDTDTGTGVEIWRWVGILLNYMFFYHCICACTSAIPIEKMSTYFVYNYEISQANYKVEAEISWAQKNIFFFTPGALYVKLSRTLFLYYFDLRSKSYLCTKMIELCVIYLEYQSLL